MKEEPPNSKCKVRTSRTHNQREQEVIDNIKNYIQERGGNYSSWCIGTAGEPHDVVLSAHAGRSLFWMYQETGSPQIARAVVDHLVSTVGINGGTEKRVKDDTGSVVYIYKKARGSRD